MSVRIEGIDSLRERLDDLADTKGLTSALRKACAVVESAAIKKAPKGTSGNLKRSIQSKVEKDGRDIVGVVFSDCDYAPYVEYGTGLFATEKSGRRDVPWRYRGDDGRWYTTSGQKPQPFLRPAFNESRERIMRLLKEGIDSG